jgi:hypothetical protein
MDAARREHLNKNTLVAEYPHGVAVVAQPGFELNRDPKFLRENFGITDPSVIKTLGESKGKILSDEEKEVEIAAEKAKAEAKAAGAPARRRAATAEV